MAVATRTATYQPGLKTKCTKAAPAARVRNVPTTPTTAIGDSGGPEPGPADVHATLKEDADQSDRDDALHRLVRRCVEVGNDLDGDGRPYEDQSRRRDLQPLCQTIRQDGDQAHDRGQQHDQGELFGLSHSGALPGPAWLIRCRPGFPVHPAER